MNKEKESLQAKARAPYASARSVKVALTKETSTDLCDKLREKKGNLSRKEKLPNSYPAVSV